jgi:hypothetical protein
MTLVDFCALQDTVDIDRGSGKILGGGWPIGNESAIVHLESIGPPLLRFFDLDQRTFADVEATSALPPES